jgi:medium-chain acyl-[acyl-carrier-protein] hydrolase
MTQNPWIKYWPVAPTGQPAIRLFCFPYAGGAASFYRDWPRFFEPGYEIGGIQLPGREQRMGETPYESLQELTAALLAAIVDELKPPFAFFGHSLGALIAFELTRALRRAGASLPAALFVSSRGAPVTRTSPPAPRRTDPELLDALQKRYGGIPERVLQDSDLMRLLLPRLRADLSLLDTYSFQPEPPLSLPIAAFGGTEDHAVPPALLQAWEGQTSASFRLEMLPGSHFYLKDSPQPLARAISGTLAEALGRRSHEDRYAASL